MTEQRALRQQREKVERERQEHQALHAEQQRKLAQQQQQQQNRSVSQIPVWYHPGLSREEAETLLYSAGAQDGLFLMRDSSSQPGAFVLSMCASVGHSLLLLLRLSSHLLLSRGMLSIT